MRTYRFSPLLNPFALNLVDAIRGRNGKLCHPVQLDHAGLRKRQEWGMDARADSTYTLSFFPRRRRRRNSDNLYDSNVGPHLRDRGGRRSPPVSHSEYRQGEMAMDGHTMDGGRPRARREAVVWSCMQPKMPPNWKEDRVRAGARKGCLQLSSPNWPTLRVGTIFFVDGRQTSDSRPPTKRTQLIIRHPR